MDRPTADRPSPPALADLPAGRFVPLTAPEREVVDAFCADTRPWALRQAKRSYRHLPHHLREQAVDRAMQELRASAGGWDVADRRQLMAEFADLLTDSLRRLHVGWCLNESTARLRREGVDTAAPAAPGVARDGLAEFVERGLGGLERAVLQLEIGAGRDSRTTRAALRLGPREYSRHREEGLSKLRDAIGARVAGRVCDQHLSSVVLAATGDRMAQNVLQSGSSRCRACAREAQGLRTVLSERLAVAPWPLVVKPAGVLAAKLGGLTALVGGNAAGGAAVVSGAGGAGAGAAATVVAVAALATGTTAVLSGTDKEIRKLPAVQAAAAPSTSTAIGAGLGERAARRSQPARPAAARKPASRKAKVVVARAEPRKQVEVRTTASRPRDASRRQAPAAVGAPPATPTAPAAAPTTAPVSTPVTLGNAVDQTVKNVNGTVKQVTKVLPPGLQQPLDATLDGVDKTVGGLTDVVDALVKPQP